MSSNSDEYSSSLQNNHDTDSIDQISYVYNLELNGGIVATLTDNDELNKVDNNTSTCEQQTDEHVPILYGESDPHC